MSTGSNVTVVGGGIAGLVAAITAAEAGARVTMHETHAELGGRARSVVGAVGADVPHRSTDAPTGFVANHGPHALYNDGPLWRWLADRDLAPAVSTGPLRGFRVRVDGEARRVPPAGLLRGIALVHRAKTADVPTDVDFRSWATERVGRSAANRLANACGVFSFHHDPGELGARFVVERAKRAFRVPPAARFVIGGWRTLVAGLEQGALARGVTIERSSPVAHVADGGPTIIATDLRAAARLLGDGSLVAAVEELGTTTVLLDVGLRARRGDPYVVSDLDEAGWIERFTASDRSLAPAGHSLLQAQVGVRPGESTDDAHGRLEALLDCSYAGWRDRAVWQRRQVVRGASGAIEHPGTTWRDRPAVDRGDGVFLAGDMVAAPGLLAEVSWASAVDAATRATAAVGLTPVGRENAA